MLEARAIQVLETHANELPRLMRFNLRRRDAEEFGAPVRH